MSISEQVSGRNEVAIAPDESMPVRISTAVTLNFFHLYIPLHQISPFHLLMCIKKAPVVHTGSTPLRCFFWWDKDKKMATWGNLTKQSSRKTDNRDRVVLEGVSAM